MEWASLNAAIFVALIGLMVVVGVHIAVIARWSGRIDGLLLAMSADDIRQDEEIKSLRQSRHDHEGRIQRHESVLKCYERRMTDHKVDRQDIDS